MVWPALRDFLCVPEELTGKGVRIAVVDGRFPNHPDITTNERRTTHIVHVMDEDAQPEVFHTEPEPWVGSYHALDAAAAAGGSGAVSQGVYAGVAPDADLFLLAMYFPGERDAPKKRYVAAVRALEWVRDNWRTYDIRAVMAAQKLWTDSGLLPWQAEPIRIACEELASEGVLVISGTGNMPDQTAAVTHAVSPSTLSVGGIAISHSGEVAEADMFQSCRGTSYEGKWVPEILAPAENIVLPQKTAEEFKNHFYAQVDNHPGRCARTSGTSFSGPIVLGAVACLWQAHPDWTAEEMKAVLIASSQTRPQWADLRAGLVSIRDAMVMERPKNISESAHYRNWIAWRERVLNDRLEALNSDDVETIKDAILSFVGDDLSVDVIEKIKKHIKHPDAQVRTVVLCALVDEPFTAEEITEALRDDSPYVQMAGIQLLRKRENLWPDCKVAFCDLINDPSLDVRYQSLLLAGEMAYPDFAEAIVSGLEEDAEMGHISIFGVRRDALEAITGQRFEQNPSLRFGQSPHDPILRDAKVVLAHKWMDWFESNWQAKQ